MFDAEEDNFSVKTTPAGRGSHPSLIDNAGRADQQAPRRDQSDEFTVGHRGMVVSGDEPSPSHLKS
jgi:hypothetical protein